MRVLVWQELFWPHIGGVEVLATKLLSALCQRGYEIVVVTRQDRLDLPREAHHHGIAVYRYPFWTAFTDRNIGQIIQIRQQVAELKRDFRPDLVHMNCFGPSFLFHHDTANAHAVPLLATLHTVPQAAMPTRALSEEGLFKRTMRTASWITCVSEAVLDQARQLMPEIAPCASVIYNGLDAPSLPPDPLPYDPPQILCLGRIIKDKGFDLAVSGFASIVARFPRTRLMIAGDGPALSELQNQVVDLGLTHSVDFLGWVSPEQIPMLLNRATVVAMPSLREGLPSVALEAALMARPVVATQVGGLPEVVLHQKTGLLVEREDKNGLAQAIAFLLNHPRIAAQFGETARRRVQKVFTFKRYVNAYDDLYQKMTGRVPCVGSA
jgi:glycogen synthase